MAVFTTLLLDLTPLLIDIRFYEDRGKYKQKKKKKNSYYKYYVDYSLLSYLIHSFKIQTIY